MNPRFPESVVVATDQLSARSETEGDRGVALASADGLLFERRSSEQRQHLWYPIRLEVEYRLLNARPVVRAGFGRTRNISRCGVLFETNDTLPPPSAEVEVLIQWPFLLDGVCPLRLVIRGHVVRTDGKTVAVRIKRHVFRTRGANVGGAKAEQGDRPSISTADRPHCR